MADEKILISVDVDVEKMQRDLSAAIETVAKLKDEQKLLRKEIESGNDTNGEMAKRLTEVTAALEKNQRQVKSQTAVMQAAVAQGLKQNASLEEQQQYADGQQGITRIRYGYAPRVVVERERAALHVFVV